MSRSPKVVPDLDLFAAVVRDAKPIVRKSRVPRQSPNRVRAAPVAAAITIAEPREAAPRRAATLPVPPLTAPKPTANPGIDRRTAERLRKGAMDINRRLDLHGMTEAAAHAALDRAVATAWREGLRVLLVITGKGSVREGGGVIRRNLPRWLAIGENAARVLRLEQAQPKHGGAGAFYVLLRRRRA